MNKHIKEAFLRAATFASRDDSRPGICGVHYRDGKLIATDGHRLCALDLGSEPWAGAFTVPIKAVDAMRGRDGVEVNEEGTLTGVIGMNLMPHTPEAFPDYTRVIPARAEHGELVANKFTQLAPANPTHVVEVDGAKIAAAVATLKATFEWSKEDKLRAKLEGIKLPSLGKVRDCVKALVNGAVYLRRDGPWNPTAARAAGFDVAEDALWSVPFDPPSAAWQPDGEFIALNVEYLTDALAGRSGRLQWTGACDPVRIDIGNEVEVIMPMRL